MKKTIMLMLSVVISSAIGEEPLRGPFTIINVGADAGSGTIVIGNGSTNTAPGGCSLFYIDINTPIGKAHQALVMQAFLANQSIQRIDYNVIGGGSCRLNGVFLGAPVL